MMRISSRRLLGYKVVAAILLNALLLLNQTLATEPAEIEEDSFTEQTDNFLEDTIADIDEFNPENFEKWQHRLGFGISLSTLKGDTAITIANIPIESEVDADFTDLFEYLDGGFLLNGLHQNGKWLVSWDLIRMDFSDKQYRTRQQGIETKGITVDLETHLRLDRFEVLFGRLLYNYEGHEFYTNVGFRYNKHLIEIDAIASRDAPFNDSLRARSRKIEEEWTDGLFGFFHRVEFGDNREFVWENRANYGVYASKGSAMFRTGIDWKFGKRWSLNTWYSWLHIDYENGQPGERNWYFIDLDEYGFGSHLVYNL